jgi:hypothetical protein
MAKGARRPSRAAKSGTPRRNAPPPAIIVHSLAQARAALEAAAEKGIEVELWSAEGAAAYAGAGWFRAILEAAGAAVPAARFEAVLDCGALPGLVLGAWRAGQSAVCFSGGRRVAAKLADIAAREGLRLRRRRPSAVLDLLRAEDPAQRCRAWLSDH